MTSTDGSSTSSASLDNGPSLAIWSDDTSLARREPPRAALTSTGLSVKLVSVRDGDPYPLYGLNEK